MVKLIHAIVLGSMILSCSAFAQRQSKSPATDRGGAAPLVFNLDDVDSEQGEPSENKILTGVILAILGNIKAANVDFGFDGSITHNESNSQQKFQIDLKSLYLDSRIRMNKNMLFSLARGSTNRNFAKMLPNIHANTENLLATTSLNSSSSSNSPLHLSVEFCKPAQNGSTCNDSNRSPLHIRVTNGIFNNIIGLGFRSISANLTISPDGTQISFDGVCDAYKILTNLTNGENYEKEVSCKFDGFASSDKKIGQKIHLVYR